MTDRDKNSQATTKPSPAKPKPRLTGAFRHFQSEMKALRDEPNNTTPVPDKGRLVFANGLEVSDNHRSPSNNQGLIVLDARQVEPWLFANRSGDALFLEELEQDMGTAGGQKSPVLVRQLDKPRVSSFDPAWMITHELIAGRRRWETIRRLEDKSLMCIVRDMDDQSAALEQEMENRRRDPSNWDDARTYQRYLDSGLYGSQKELCKHLGIEPTKLSQLLNYTRLPAALTKAITPMHKVSIHTVRILRAYTRHKDKEISKVCLAYALEKSKQIQSGELHFQQLEKAFNRLITPTPKPLANKQKVTSKGRDVCEIKKNANGKITISLDSEQLADFLESGNQKKIKEILSKL